VTVGEQAMRRGTAVATPAIAAVCAAAALTAVCPATATTARDSKFQPNLQATVRYLQNAQRENGGFAEPGDEPEADFSAWVTLALAAAGINPRDQTTAKQHYQAGHSAYAYLAEHAHEASSTTDFERELLVVDAAGTSPHDFGGVDLVGEILKRQITQGAEAGGFPHQAGSQEAGINDTIFAILSLSPIREQPVQEAIGRAAEWLEAQQYCDGSWPEVFPHTPKKCTKRQLPGKETGEVDMTAAALEAVNAAKRSDSQRQAWAFEYLHEAQTPNGGFVEFLGETEPNVASTAWVAQAMWSSGINPETWTTRSGLTSEEPLGYLASMQQEDGHIRWKQGEESNGMWMTAYVLPAFTGNPAPFPEVPYEPLPALPPEAATSSTGPQSAGAGEGGSGDSGVSGSKGGGVIAGGGGDGAPLFSRPQPASKGHTPGGDRQPNQPKSQKHMRRHTHRRNPGTARRRVAPTITIAKPSRARVRQDPASSSSAMRLGRTRGSADRGAGPGAEAAGTGSGSGGSGKGGVSLPGAEAAKPSRTATGAEVKGVLIGSPKAATNGDQLEAGAPGLRSAGEGDDRGQWLTIAIYAAIAVLILTGALIEQRRPQTTL
jgi:Squalene-hopene cyclase C-terminal domain/Prenyltransferase and squalene oxidase repeat